MIKRNSSFNVLYTSDVKATNSFYEKIGAEIVESKDNKVVVHLGDFSLHFILDKTEPTQECQHIVKTSPRGGSLMFYVEVDNLEKYYDLVKQAGGKIVFDPAERPWGQVEFLFEDPNGYRIIFYKNL